MAKSKRLEKMSVIDDIFEEPVEIYKTDLPIEMRAIRELKQKSQSNSIEAKPVIKNELSTNKVLIENNNKPVTRKETRNKGLIEFEENTNGKVIKDEQRTNKPVTEKTQLSLDFVSSYQRDILQVIFQEIQANPFEKETRPLNIKNLGLLLGITETKTLESLRIVILRLEKMGFLTKTKVKTGRAGWTCYTLPNQIFEQILRSNQFAKPVIKNELSTNKELTKPVITDLSKKESNNNISFFIPEVLKNIGLKETMIKTDRKDLQEILNHLSFSLEKKEFKTTNPLATVISIINNGKNWVSGKFIEEENQVLKQQERRLQELQLIKQQQLLNAYQLHKLENPDYLDKVKAEQKFQVNEEILEQIAFETFKNSL